VQQKGGVDMQERTRSAFPPIKPTALAERLIAQAEEKRTVNGPATVVKQPPSPPSATSRSIKPVVASIQRPSSPKAGGIVSMPIELLITVHDEPEKLGVGYSFFTRGRVAENALLICLNRHRLIVSKALSKADVVTTTFLYSLLLAECCALRRHQSVLVDKLQQTLAAPLYTPSKIARNQIFADFAMRLALSPVMEGVRNLPIFGPAPKEEGTHLLYTVVLEVSAAEALSPWKRLSSAGYFKKTRRPARAKGPDTVATSIELAH
jgi:hypothetical protein